MFEESLLKYLSQEDLKKIQSKKIGIGGAGGLGSNVAITLTRCGFKHFTIIDHDIIEESNLNRQYYFQDDIGEKKVFVLANRITDINPQANIRTFYKRWIPEEGENYFFNSDFIIEAFDVAKTKCTFTEYYQNKTPYVISGNGMAGLHEKKPLKIKKVGNIYFVGDLQTNTADGHPPLAPRVITCAAMMAEIILDLTLKKP